MNEGPLQKLRLRFASFVTGRKGQNIGGSLENESATTREDYACWTIGREVRVRRIVA